MSATFLLRLSGIVLLIAAPLAPLGHWLHPDGHTVALATTDAWVPAHTSVWLWALLTALALPGLFAYLAPRVGRWAVVAFALQFTHLTNAIAGMQKEALTVAALADDPASHHAAEVVLSTSGGLVSTLAVLVPGVLGGILFGILLIRVGGAWRGPGIALAVSPVLVILLFMTGNGYWAFRIAMPVGELAHGWAGFLLWRRAGEAAPLAAPPPGVTAAAA